MRSGNSSFSLLSESVAYYLARRSVHPPLSPSIGGAVATAAKGEPDHGLQRLLASSQRPGEEGPSSSVAIVTSSLFIHIQIHTRNTCTAATTTTGSRFAECQNARFQNSTIFQPITSIYLPISTNPEAESLWSCEPILLGDTDRSGHCKIAFIPVATMFSRVARVAVLAAAKKAPVALAARRVAAPFAVRALQTREKSTLGSLLKVRGDGGWGGLWRDGSRR